MGKQKYFPFEKARRLSNKELSSARKAIEEVTGKKRNPRGRPSKGITKFRPISIRLHPTVLAWAKREAKKEGYWLPDCYQ
jgi:hypothetical protein